MSSSIGCSNRRKCVPGALDIVKRMGTTQSVCQAVRAEIPTSATPIAMPTFDHWESKVGVLVLLFITGILLIMCILFFRRRPIQNREVAEMDRLIEWMDSKPELFDTLWQQIEKEMEIQ